MSALGYGTTPLPSPGRPRPTFSPKPKCWKASTIASRPSLWPIFAAQMLEDTCSTPCGLSTPCGWVSCTVYLPTAQRPFSQSSSVSVVMTFFSSAAATTKALKVEPGSKASVTARLRKDSRELPCGELGLKVGALATASSSPVRGSSTTAMPAMARESSTALLSARSVTICSCRSSVKVTAAPRRLVGSSTPWV